MIRGRIEYLFNVFDVIYGVGVSKKLHLCIMKSANCKIRLLRAPEF